MDGQGSERRLAVVVDDDADVRGLIQTVLQQAGFEVHTRDDGESGVEAVRELDPVVTTLDVNMPGIDGFETARRIRAVSSTYIIMLSGLQDEIDTLQGLDAGADDYIVKPFRPRELRARIEAMLRRPRDPRALGGLPESVLVTATNTATRPAPPPSTDAVLEHHGIRLDRDARIAELDGAEVTLTRSEFDLLATLMASGRRVRSKTELARAVRGDDYAGDIFVAAADERAIEVHMANLRKKLGESTAAPRWIETVRGVGYRLTAP
ncbi:MAG: response regulator transcription factor [Actinomycetales bacterium]|nr:response regulator transcription factor [Actinomycetales bacterium]